MGLVAQEHTPSKTPWWILLLRLLIAALVIIALARPVLHPANALIGGSGALRLIMDNSWAGAQNWEQQKKTAQDAIAQAGREKRDIFILTTAPMAGAQEPLHSGALTQDQALATLRALTPQPWSARYEAMQDILAKNTENKTIYSLWLSHGLDEGKKTKALLETLQQQGGLTYISPKPENLPPPPAPYTPRGEG